MRCGQAVGEAHGPASQDFAELSGERNIPSRGFNPQVFLLQGTSGNFCLFFSTKHHFSIPPSQATGTT
jgi:hypothetical protein